MRDCIECVFVALLFVLRLPSHHRQLQWSVSSNLRSVLRNFYWIYSLRFIVRIREQNTFSTLTISEFFSPGKFTSVMAAWMTERNTNETDASDRRIDVLWQYAARLSLAHFDKAKSPLEFLLIHLNRVLINYWCFISILLSFSSLFILFFWARSLNDGRFSDATRNYIEKGDRPVAHLTKLLDTDKICICQYTPTHT